jgi:hypothetical protein
LTKGQRLKVTVDGGLVYAEVIEVTKLATEPVKWKLLARELDPPGSHRVEMRIISLSKTAMVAAIALFASLVAFGNITDYGTNWAFVQHVLSMDTVFPTTTRSSKPPATC